MREFTIFFTTGPDFIFYKYYLYSDGFMQRSGGTPFLTSQLPNVRNPLDMYYADGKLIADTTILSLEFQNTLINCLRSLLHK